MEDKIITCPKCGSRHLVMMGGVFTGFPDTSYKLFCKDCGQMFEKTGQEIKEHYEEKGKQFTCPKCGSHSISIMELCYSKPLLCKHCGYRFDEDEEPKDRQFTCPDCKGHDVILIDRYTNNIYEVVCKSCGKLLILTPDRTHEEKEDNTMKCQRCGKEMRNTIGGCYTCDECGFGINDLVYRGGRGMCVNGLQTESLTTPYTNDVITSVNGIVKERTESTTLGPYDTPSNIGTVTIPRSTDKATIPDWSNHGWVQQGWQCPKCGAILSPNTPFCPFCSRQTITPTVTCGTSGEYINPNVSTSISKDDK